jgi:hydroxymethylglutaryl-CoA lyase
MKLPSAVTICEVGTRDGFQIEEGFIPTDEKVEIVNRLSACGIPEIQATSFVHPKVVPQMRDAEEVMARITRHPGTRYTALVPNDRGALRAVEAGVDQLDTVLSASESHNIANVNMTVAESLDRLAAVADVAARAGVPVVAGISTSFGCPFEGEVPLDHLEAIVARLADLGAEGITLADTTGMANPAQVARTFERLMPKWPHVQWHLHTHDTRAMAIPNILAAMECGVTHFDSSVGGLGGCPFAPGASGNVCTEDLAHCLEAMDVRTGIDLDRLLDTSRYVEGVVGHTLPGQVVKAGRFTRRYPAPDPVAERLAAMASAGSRWSLAETGRGIST